MWGWTAPCNGVPAEQKQFLCKGHLIEHTPLHIRAPRRWKSRATAHQVCTALQHSADDYAFKDARSEKAAVFQAQHRLTCHRGVLPSIRRRATRLAQAQVSTVSD